MSRLPRASGREAVSAFERVGFAIRRQPSGLDGAEEILSGRRLSAKPKFPGQHAR